MQPNPATESTRAVTTAAPAAMDPADFERARRGLVAEHPTGLIEGGPLGTVWDTGRYGFVDGDAPDTVHPSLWRQARLNNIHGLFQVADGIWQVRGYDIANVTLIAGTTGWVVIDPLTTEQTARASLALADAHLGARPVTAVIYTHSHVDHFGGVHGVTTPADVEAGRCRVIAPQHFLHETVAENVIAGPAMLRRAHYQFGPLLPPGPTGHVDCGLGKAIPLGTSGLIAPTDEITHTGQELTVDGVQIVFQSTPDTEAPAEMNCWFPDRRWLCMAENCTHTMHNLIPIRGAQARNSLNWSKYIDEALDLWGPHAEVMFASHHWPRWGNDDIGSFLGRQRDLYKYVHDQTMRHANHGLVPTEIAEVVTLPDEFRSTGDTTGYYGHLAHNVKAVYQRYLSWYDGNPAHLWQLPPGDTGPRYVELAGGPDALLASARAAYDRGEYRWVVELVDHLVFADPAHTGARRLQADALEQLGYQSESATFRNAYLTGAHELRHGHLPRTPVGVNGFVAAATVEQLIDVAAVRLMAEHTSGLAAIVNLDVAGHPAHRVTLSNRTLHGRAGHSPHPDATLIVEHRHLVELCFNTASVTDLVTAGSATIDGDPAAVDAVFGHLDTFYGMFPIVEP